MKKVTKIPNYQSKYIKEIYQISKRIDNDNTDLFTPYECLTIANNMYNNIQIDKLYKKLIVFEKNLLIQNNINDTQNSVINRINEELYNINATVKQTNKILTESNNQNFLY